MLRMLDRRSVLRAGVRSYSLVHCTCRSPSRVQNVVQELRRCGSMIETWPRTWIVSSASISKQFSTTFGSDEAHKYAQTLLLPKTSFPMRALASVREPLLRDRICDQAYRNQEDRSSAPVWCLHDGPPYANGDVHCGHALNKILKDIINRYKQLQGYRIDYVPGWDCHGLPIELKALEAQRKAERKIKKRNMHTRSAPQSEGVDEVAKLRQTAANFARDVVGKQGDAFRSWSVMGDWSNAYLTMDKEYEAEQMDVFLELVKKGCIYRSTKPVYWSPYNRTALAEGELEYPPDHVSRSVYACFRVTENDPLLKRVGESGIKSLDLCIWTTTPWTLVSNRAVCARPGIDYSILIKKDRPDHGYIVATKTVENMKSIMGGTDVFQVNSIEIDGSELDGCEYHHPIDERLKCKVLLSSHVATSTGTGLVHTAPGHGLEDYRVGMHHAIQPYSPVDESGRFTKDVGEEMEGKFVLTERLKMMLATEGTEAVIAKLDANGMLLHSYLFHHKYPYDWRSRKPIIIRATPQWFVNVKELVPSALEALELVQFVPPEIKNRLVSTVSAREDWCISRQRYWGVPIPVFYRKDGSGILMEEESIRHVIDLVRQRGSNVWYEATIEDLLPPKYKDQASLFERGMDTIDVWFDSGCSWKAVTENQIHSKLQIGSAKVNRGQADLYLEGSDQHRGWFQSSLLTCAALRGYSPFSTLISVGFVVDGDGRKMSKSLGNVISPSTIISGGKDKKAEPAYGVDVLRLWVASAQCYGGDISMGPLHVAKVFETSKKLRNTLRFLLGNLSDLHLHDTALPLEPTEYLDRMMLGRLHHVFREIESCYENYNFPKDLSSFYFDGVKDILYAEPQKSVRRMSAQRTLLEILQCLRMAIAPITPHTAEDVFLHSPDSPYGEQNDRSNIDLKSVTGDGLFSRPWPSTKPYDEYTAEDWDLLQDVRKAITRAANRLRDDNLVEKPVDTVATVTISSSHLYHLLQKAYPNLHLLSNVSEVTLQEGDPHGEEAFAVTVSPATKRKCNRCWLSICEDRDEPLCRRCRGAVSTFTDQ